jgi:hypothetical protein
MLGIGSTPAYQSLKPSTCWKRLLRFSNMIIDLTETKLTVKQIADALRILAETADRCSSVDELREAIKQTAEIPDDS